MRRDELLLEGLFLCSLTGLDALFNAQRLVAGSRINGEFLSVIKSEPDITGQH